MTFTLEAGATKKKLQAVLMKIAVSMEMKRSKHKDLILQETFGKIDFKISKTPLQIQYELIDEWNIFSFRY